MGKFIDEGILKTSLGKWICNVMVSLSIASIINTAKMHIVKKLTVTEEILDQAIHFTWDGLKELIVRDIFRLK